MMQKDMAAQIAADNAMVEEVRAKAGEAEAAKLAGELYKLRRSTPDGLFSATPRGIIILIAIWVGLLETADKLPQLFLAYPKYEATLAEYRAKTFQPALVAAQAYKAEIDAGAAGQTLQSGSAARLGIMFDLLDPNHPHLVSQGAIDTTKKLPDLLMSIK